MADDDDALTHMTRGEARGSGPASESSCETNERGRAAKASLSLRVCESASLRVRALFLDSPTLDPSQDAGTRG